METEKTWARLVSTTSFGLLHNFCTKTISGTVYAMVALFYPLWLVVSLYEQSIFPQATMVIAQSIHCHQLLIFFLLKWYSSCLPDRTCCPKLVCRFEQFWWFPCLIKTHLKVSFHAFRWTMLTSDVFSSQTLIISIPIIMVRQRRCN
jgi:hypothetical protein